MAAKIHLYKYWGEIQGGGVPRMPLHHLSYFRYPFFNTGVNLLSGANCLVPPSPFSIKVKSLICSSEES